MPAGVALGRRFWVQVVITLLVLSLSASAAPSAPAVIIGAAEAMIGHFIHALTDPIIPVEDTSDNQE